MGCSDHILRRLVPWLLYISKSNTPSAFPSIPIRIPSSHLHNHLHSKNLLLLKTSFHLLLRATSFHLLLDQWLRRCIFSNAKEQAEVKKNVEGRRKQKGKRKRSKRSTIISSFKISSSENSSPPSRSPPARSPPTRTPVSDKNILSSHIVELFRFRFEIANLILWIVHPEFFLHNV